MGALTLVLGGVRSGKSRQAEQLVAAWPPVLYLATAQAGDAEMARRIRAHQQRRPAAWQTVEEPWDPARVVTLHPHDSLVLECVSLWLTNLLVGLPDRQALEDAAIRSAVAQLVTALQQRPGRSVLVSNETGLGIMPDNPLARRYGDLLGEANQALAAAATEVIWCVAGIPTWLKGRPEGPTA